MALSPAVMRLAAKMLGLAADEFCGHGCNDFDPPADFPREEWVEFVRQAHMRNGDPEEFDPARPNMPDWWVMANLSHLLKEEAGK